MRPQPDMSKYVPIQAPIPANIPPLLPSGRNPFLRCPTPQCTTMQADALRQYLESGVPQYRIIPPLQHGVRPDVI